MAVTADSVILTWPDHPAYPYSYGLVLLAESAPERIAVLRETDGHFRRNVLIRDGVWSYYLFH